jgi:predicted nucleic acid-binding protein
LKVVDASALVELLLETPRGRRVDTAIDEDEAVGPDLVHTEVASALARRLRAGDLGQSEADRAIELLSVMPLDIAPARVLTKRAWELRDRVRVADGFYVACAELFEVPLVTCDGRLARAPLPGVTIIHVN